MAWGCNSTAHWRVLHVDFEVDADSDDGWEVFQRPIGVILRTSLRGSLGTSGVLQETPFRGIRDSGYQDLACPCASRRSPLFFCDYSIADITQKVKSFFKIILQIVIIHENTGRNLCNMHKLRVAFWIIQVRCRCR